MKTRYRVPDLPLFTKNVATKVYNDFKQKKDLGQYIFQTEQKEKNSLFICSIAHCDSVESGKLFVDTLKNMYGDATHNCWAFQVKQPHSTAFVGCSDDGEPQGTAGRPMLNQLIHSSFGEIAAVITRYFGGTKLGTGGLVRAYQGGVAFALESLPHTLKCFYEEVELVLDYVHVDIFYKLLPKYEIHILKTIKEADICFNLQIPEDKVQDFIDEIILYTQGTVLVKIENKD